MRNLRIGVLGCASVAQRLVIPAMKELKFIDLVAVSSRSEDKANQFSIEFGCRPIHGYLDLINLDDIDVIYMPLPTGLHLEWAVRALNAGKHLFIEKSLASNLSEVNLIIDLAKSKNLLIMENYMFEHHSQQNVVAELMGEFVGDVRTFRASFGFPPLNADNFRYDPLLGGGALLDAGGYVLKSLTTFFPDYATEIQASNITIGLNGVDVAGSAMINLTKPGQIITANIAFGFDHYYQCGIEMWGSKGKLSTNRTFTAGPNLCPIITIENADGLKNIRVAEDNHFKKILTYFFKVISGSDFSSEYLKIQKQAELQESFRKKAHLFPLK